MSLLHLTSVIAVGKFYLKVWTKWPQRYFYSP